MNCPMCGLINPPDAQRCDCGFDFQSRRMGQSLVDPRERARLAENQATRMGTLNGFGITLYGRAKGYPLTGVEAENAKQAGLEPYSYQATQWLTALYLPVVPLGTYRVLRAAGSGFFRGRYLMTKASWDWKQIGVHYAIGWGWLVALALATSR